MSDNKLTDERGLYQLPDEPDAAPCEYCKGTRVCSVCDGRGTIQEGWGIGGMDALACGSCGGEGGCSFCEPDAAPQGSVSAPVSAMGRADAPVRECPFCGEKPRLFEQHGVWSAWCVNEDCPATTLLVEGYSREEVVPKWNRRDGEAARVAEAVAQERARIERELTLLMENTGGLVAWVRTLKVIRGAPAYGTTSAEEYPAQPPGSGDAP
jgi:hypothetical protein